MKDKLTSISWQILKFLVFVWVFMGGLFCGFGVFGVGSGLGLLGGLCWCLIGVLLCIGSCGEKNSRYMFSHTRRSRFTMKPCRPCEKKRLSHIATGAKKRV